MRIRGRSRLAGEVLLALWPMVLIEVGLRTRGLPATCARLRVACDLGSAAPPAAEPAVLPPELYPAVRACHAVVSRWPGGNTCLRQCLLLGHRLRGLQPVLRIGVRRDRDGVFSAHSWLEAGGRTLDPSASEYATLGTAGGSGSDG